MSIPGPAAKNIHSAVLLIITLILIGFANHAIGGEIHEAASKGDLEKVKMLLKDHPELALSMDDHGKTPLHDAALAGNTDMITLLLQRKADINALDEVGYSPLSMAALAGSKSAADLLLANKANVNAGRPLSLAIFSRHQDIADLLLANNADCDIFQAAAAGGLKKVKQFIEADPSLVSAKDAHSLDTPLHWAAKMGHEDVVEFLLSKKADVNAEDVDKLRPLHMAAVNGQLEIAGLLLAHKADVNAADGEGMTPLQWAAFIGDAKMAELLLANKADVDGALFWTQPPGPDGAMRIPDSTRHDSWTRSRKEIVDGRPAVAELLRKHGAKASPEN